MIPPTVHKISKLIGLLFIAAIISLSPESSADPDDAIKHYIIVELLPEADQLELDRYYLRHHAPEVRRAVKAWQKNYVSYRSYQPTPIESERFNVATGRLTEIHFGDLRKFKSSRRNNLYGDLSSYTPPPGGWKGNSLFKTHTITLSVNPTELPISRATPPKAHPYLRWILFISDEDNQFEYFKTELQPSLATNPDVLRLGIYKSKIQDQEFGHAIEIWFNDLRKFRSIVTNSEVFSDTFFENNKSILVGENPDIDFINDHRVIP